MRPGHGSGPAPPPPRGRRSRLASRSPGTSPVGSGRGRSPGRRSRPTIESTIGTVAAAFHCSMAAIDDEVEVADHGVVRSPQDGAGVHQHRHEVRRVGRRGRVGRGGQRQDQDRLADVQVAPSAGDVRGRSLAPDLPTPDGPRRRRCRPRPRCPRRRTSPSRQAERQRRVRARSTIRSLST